MQPVTDLNAALAGTKEIFRKAAHSGKEAADALQAVIDYQDTEEGYGRLETAHERLASAAFDARVVAMAWEENRVAVQKRLAEERERLAAIARGPA